MSDYGFRISKTGTDVKTGDDKDMVVTSKYSVLKGFLSGTGTATVARNGVAVTVTIAHSLGYIPSIQGYWNDRDGDVYDSTDYYPIPFATASGILDFYFIAKTDSTNAYLTFIIDDYGVGDPSIHINYAYYIFIDKGKL